MARLTTDTLGLSHLSSCEQGRGEYALVRKELSTVRRVSNGLEPRTQQTHTDTRETPLDFVTNSPHNQEVSIRQSHGRKARQRQVLYLIICSLCLSAAIATFTVIVLEFSQARSPISGGIQAVILAIFSAPLAIYVCVTGAIIFRICQVQTDSRPALQACLETYRGSITDTIGGCVVYQAILLHILRAYSQPQDGQNALDYTYQVTTVFLALALITHWCSGGRNARAESTDTEPTAAQSRGGRHAGAGEADSWGLPGDASDTFDSFTHVGDVEMAGLTPAVD